MTAANVTEVLSASESLIWIAAGCLFGVAVLWAISRVRNAI